MKTYNTAPYFDDFDENNKFYRILFRPGYAVQARELTQLQSILQNQVRRHGDHIFKEGAMVIPGQMSIDTEIKYVKLQSTTIDVTKLIGFTATNLNGLTAQIVYATASTSTDSATLFVKYTNSGDDTETKTFTDNESITINQVNVVQTALSDATGVGSIATIQRGVYYVKGHFVLCDEQTIALDKYSNTPTYRVGLEIVEREISPEEDQNLLDNAQGSYNYAAPGAHRYYIDLVLTKYDLANEQDDSFVELLQVDAGKIKRHVVKTEYSEIEKTLARRTYDESGNYTVRPFAIDVREHRNNNRGQWVSGVQYLIGDVVINNDKTYVAKRTGISGLVAPAHLTGTTYDGPGNTGVQWEYNETPYYNRGIYTPEDGGTESKLAIGLEPGKAYVEGYEIEKIATEYVTINKARDVVQVDNAIVPTTVGNYVLMTNVNNLPPITSFGTITLYNRLTSSRGVAAGTAIGTARARFIEWENGTIGTTTATYMLGLFDIKLQNGYDFNRDVKSFYFNVSNDPNLSFTGDIKPILFQLIGSVSASASTTVIGSGTSFVTDLKVGDYVQLGENIRRVVTINSQNQITVDSSVTVTGSTISLVTTIIHEPNAQSLVFNLPYYAIKSVRSALNTNDTSYTVYQSFTGTSSGVANNVCTLVLSTASGVFASAADNDNYILMNNSAASGGTVVAPLSVVVSGSNVTFTLDQAYASLPFTVIAAVIKTGTTLTEKIKTLRLVGETGTTIYRTTKATATATEISLGKADCYRVVSVKMATGTFDNPGQYTIDITDRYDFDDGQRDTHYDVGRLRLKASYTPPSAPIEIKFEYFDHSTGDYFTVNSYGDYSTETSNTSNIAYQAIPFYNGVSLGDCIDFRPRVADNGLNFTGAGSSMSLVPKRGDDVRTDFKYHLARKTKIAIDFGGNFFVIDGISSLNPGEPQNPSMGMVLYNLTLEPYTYTTDSNSISIFAYDNKRYTMRDIGKLEKRIDNLEYYTSLSLLEQQTESLDIIDSDGLDRFKNGFIVDGFVGHNTGDTTSPDYLCAIDMERAELRPFFSMQNVSLMERAKTDSTRIANNYKLYGDVITLPVVSEIPLVKQDYASRLENINPFAIFTFLGNVNINPSSDDWFEVNRRPDIVNQVEGNFNTIKTLAEKAGVLGTVWNSWQTQWTGSSITQRETFTAANARWGNGVWANARALNQGATQISLAEMNARFGAGNNIGLPARQVTVQSTATQVGQTRTGVKTTVVAKIDRQVVADRVLSTAVIPYIRSRNILIQVSGLKPNTRFYPFFDNINVQKYCTQASKLVYLPQIGEFDSSTNVGGDTSATERRINGDTQVCLNRGDVIRGSVSGATAVVVGSEYNSDTKQYALYVINRKGTFSAADTITGTISNATGKFISLSSKNIGQNLVSNVNGDLQLLFNIPNTESIRFRTGTREFKLVDTDQSEGEFTSRGRANYRAEGVLETRQATVNAVRNGELVQEQVRDNRVVVQTSSRVVADTGWYDPLAQTFLVQSPGGAFLTKVDIFFATKDEKVPVNLEIREVVNGYPGKVILPFSKTTLKPEQVKLSSSTVSLDGVQVRKYDTPTSFVFKSPVYVQDNQEYAIVLSSDSNNYKVWISQLGDQIPGSTRTISEQPYMGVFFKSQNASTWTADQMQDLKFTIYRAEFATNTIGNVEFVNTALPYDTLENNPIETREGITKVRVYHRNHGMPVGSRVDITDATESKITGVTGSGKISTSTSTAVSGVGTTFSTQLSTGSVLYTLTGSYIGVVANVTSNTTLTLTTLPQQSITSGNFLYRSPLNGIPATEIYKVHTIADVDTDSYSILTASPALTSGYTGGNTIRATHNIQFDEFQPAIQMQTFPETEVVFNMKAATGKSPDSRTQSAYVIPQTFTSVLVNENNQLVVPHMVSSEINENTLMSGNKSLTLQMSMMTNNANVSPILDMHRTSFIAINNKINNPQEENINVGGLDENILVSESSLITISDNSIVTTDPDTKDIFKTVQVGKYITIRGSVSGEKTDLVVAVAEDGSSITLASQIESITTAITLIQRELFVDEIAPEGSSTFSKYVTKQVNLTNPSTYMRIRFAASIPSEAAIDVYYRVLPVGSTTPLQNRNWNKVSSDQPIVNSQIGSGNFIDMTFSTGDLATFNAAQVKLVMRSSNTSAIPIIKDLRVIACA